MQPRPTPDSSSGLWARVETPRVRRNPRNARVAASLVLLMWVGAGSAWAGPRADDGLLAAVRSANTERVQSALSRGASPDARDDRGWTALGYAAMGGHETIADLLIRAGADVNVRTGDGSTPLMVAAVMGHAPLVRLLLAAGADPRLQNDAGANARLKAEQYGHPDIALLLENAPLPSEVREAAPARDTAPTQELAAPASEAVAPDDPAPWVKPVDGRAVEYVVRTDGVIRAQAGQRSRRLGALPAGTRVLVWDKERDWYQVEYEGTRGFMYETLLEPAVDEARAADESPARVPSDAPRSPLELATGRWATPGNPMGCNRDFLEIRVAGPRVSLVVHAAGEATLLADRQPVLLVEGDRIQVGGPSFRWNLEPTADDLRYQAQGGDPVLYRRCGEAE